MMAIRVGVAMVTMSLSLLVVAMMMNVVEAVVSEETTSDTRCRRGARSRVRPGQGCGGSGVRRCGSTGRADGLRHGPR